MSQSVGSPWFIRSRSCLFRAQLIVPRVELNGVAVPLFGCVPVDANIVDERFGKLDYRSGVWGNGDGQFECSLIYAPSGFDETEG